LGILVEVAAGLALLYAWLWFGWTGFWGFGLAVVIAYPVLWAHLIVLPLIGARFVIMGPRNYWQVRASERIFAAHPGQRIAITGSYGKTSMKELLLTVLGDGLHVRATPANKNVAVSHAAFARSLKGNEDILLIEYGEGKPGDVARFARTTHPTRAVITGVAAAHLDHYKSTAAAGKDIFSVAKYIDDKSHLYINSESPAAQASMKPAYQVYGRSGALGWKVSNAEVDITGLGFALRKGKRHLQLRSGLLGRHNIGPLSFAAALAADFGMVDKDITNAIAKTAPFEHRMQPYQLNGAWVIDDTYNGNIEGIRAGTELLKELPAKRKLYVTPGLVDQGAETEAIHKEMGRLIAVSGANVVVLMQNSVVEYIKAGLDESGFTGELRIEQDPLSFYTGLGLFLAAGDLALLQNDWPDNYA
jgi:UDP-N-acetylmuramoyl-tripeptide--D-alanyl-D-alanine ligase